VAYDGLGMRGHHGSLAWKKVFAAGLLVRPILIVPMAPSGPLGGSELLPLGLASVFAGSFVLAAGAWLGVRVLTAFGIISALAGVALAAIGAVLGLPEPWPLLLVGLNAALVPAGIEAWEEPGRSARP
jgi:hypothetical protein